MSLPFHYENLIGRLDIKPSVDPEDVFLWVHEGSNQAAIHIANKDAPTVAAELLKAAGQEGVFVAKAYEGVRADRFGDLQCGSGPEAAYASVKSNPNWLHNRAANYIALAEYIESKAQRETEAATKLQERRDELAAEFSMGAYSYEVITPMVKFAIDRIIELEDAANA